ncbi:MAG TPA: ABC transporter ATP-binding protein [Mycobacteriales bacterium]|nr:ABC transporter ATP-binding protein [Mycobacteriales bacterium]
MTRSQVVLRVSGLSVRRQGAEVVRNVSLDIGAGEVVAVLGPNGAGKSTLLAAIAGVLAPAAGDVQRNGRIATAMQSPDLARRSALANVELALAWWGVPRRERRSRAHAALDAMQATHLADRAAAAMSGGERRRVHIARALALRPDLLVLDEPFAGLDSLSRGALLDDTASVLRDPDRAALIVVHDRSEAWALADRLVVLLDGRVAAMGRPKEVLDAPPTAPVARFLGFSGRIRQGDGWLLTRPSHVSVQPDGPFAAVVRRQVPVEDGVRLALDVEGGELWTVVAEPGPGVGASVRVCVNGGVRFPADGE